MKRIVLAALAAFFICGPAQAARICDYPAADEDGPLTGDEVFQVMRCGSGAPGFQLNLDDIAAYVGAGGIGSLVEDTSPQLGSNLDLNGNTVGDATAADLTKLHALTATSTELNYVDGVTSALQTQIDGKQATLTNSAGLRGALSDESGTGAAYFQGGDIGTPSAGVGTNFTGTASGLTAGAATLASTATIVDGTDATSFPLIADSATGSLALKTDGGLLYDASNGTLSSTIFNTPTLTLTGTGTLNGLEAIDGTGETTLEAALDIGGEVTSTGMGAAVVADSVAVSSWNITTAILSGKVNADGSAVSDDDCTGEQGLFWYDDTDAAFEFCNANTGVPTILGGGGGGGAPADADYLVGTANGSLSAEIVVGTSPGGELGGTWASPTVDDGVTVATWTMTGAPGLTVSNSTTSAGSINFREDGDNGSNNVTLIGSASTSDATLTLQGTTGTLYSSNGTDVAVADGGTGAGTKASAQDNLGVRQEYCVALSDQTTNLTTGTGKATLYFPAAATVDTNSVRAYVNTAPTGSTIIVDINEGGTTIMSTNKLSIDASEKTSGTAATGPGVTDTAIAANAEITFDIDQVGSSTPGKGLVACIEVVF
jgi:hypothetical protein